MKIDELFKTSIIKGLLFSALDKLGPQPIYMFPKEISEQDAEALKEQSQFKVVKLTYRDYMQISIKNLSLFIGDREISKFEFELEKMPYYAILPYPDFNLTSLTYFNLIKFNFSETPIAASFSILVDRNSRSFLYNNINRFKTIISQFFHDFHRLNTDGYKSKEETEPIFKDLFLKIIEIEKKPFSSITSERKMKIIFAGLDDSGKTSFLLTIDRKYSKLIGLKPTIGAHVSSLRILGASIFLWDLGGQSISREKYLNKSQIYLYDTDLLFYFIDIKNKERFEESLRYYESIRNELEKFNQETPIIFILSKGDEDIIQMEEIKNNVAFITTKLKNYLKNKELEFYITSIFSVFSILRAFSSGLSKLSPNRELINLNLKKLSDRVGIYFSLLLNSEGFVIAEYFSKDPILIADSIIETDDLQTKKDLLNIFEITAPQFAMLFKIFIEFQTIKKEEAIFKISNSVIYIKKILISDFVLFVLFVMDEESKKELIINLIADFTYRTSDLLLRFIS